MAEQSLPDLWKEAEARFQIRTGKPLRRTPAKTLEDVRKEIESQQTESSKVEKEDTKTRAKEASMNALQCLKLLGGVAAQGASMVFGPADLCFNAVSILIDIPSNIHEFHEAVDGLFEEVSVFLSHFKIYSRIEALSSIDPELMRIIHKLMISFVDICALSITLRKSGKWKSFKGSFKKVIFNDDSGVSKEIEGFQALIATHSSIQGTITLEKGTITLQEVLNTRKDLVQILTIACETKESISDIAKRLEHVAEGVDVLTTAENARKTEQTTKENQKKLVEKLLGSTDIAQRSTTTCNEYWEASIKGSGDWMHDRPEYQDWVDRKPEVNPLLLITGDTNAGKSFLSSVIVHQLKSPRGNPLQAAVRTPVVAYHFFPKKTEKSTKDENPAETALKCLALQIAECDHIYAKKILALFSEGTWTDDIRFKKLSCRELWEGLNFIVPKRDLTYFIILDGLDQLSDGNSEQLLGILSGLENSLADSDHCQLRVLATGIFSKTFSEERFGDVPRINISDWNTEEIGRYIDHELKKRDLLQGKDPETVKLRDSILDQLPNQVGGDYFKVETTLLKINDLVSSDGSASEVESILKEAGQSRELIAQDVVDAANQTLSAKEIDELNEILVWVMYGADWIHINDLQAALYLRFQTIPLQPLQKKLSGKYSKFFDVNGGWVTVDEDIEEVVKTSASTRIKVEETPRITATITITKANLRVAQNFLWNLCEKGVMDKFEFNESAAATTIKDTIRVNEFDAHLWIIKQSLKLLSAEPDDRTQALARYVLVFFPNHLDSLRKHPKFENLEEKEKGDIGHGVYLFIGDGDILEKFWGASGPPGTNWIEQEEDIGVMWKWLEDPDATRHLGKKDKEWLRSIKQDTNPDRGLLRPIVKMVAKHWLLDRAWEVRATFEWIRSFLQMKIQKKTASEEEVENSNGEREIPDEVEEIGKEVPGDENSSYIGELDDAKAVAAAAKWVQKVHEVTTLDSLWYERLGETYLAFSEYEQAIEAFNLATKFDNPSWRCSRSLALALAGRNEQGDIALAASEMEKALEILRKAQGIPEEKGDAKSSLIDNLMQMAEWQIELQSPENAKACYLEVLEVEPDRYAAHYEILKIYLRTGQEELFRAALEILSKEKSTGAELSKLGSLLTFMVGVPDLDTIFGMMFLATQKTALFDILLGNLHDAQEMARKEDRTDELAVLLLHTGIALYYFDQREHKNPESALSIWAECGTLSSNPSAWWSSIRAFRLISFHHFNRAMASQDPSPHVEKLKQVVSHPHVTDHYSKSFLGYYYAHSGNPDAAKRLRLDDFNTALALLSDEWEWNDYQGYLYLADILLHCGDYLNALSAWSLIIPDDVDLTAKILDSLASNLSEPMISIVRDLKNLISNEVQTISTQRQLLGRLIQDTESKITDLKADIEPDSARIEALEEVHSLLTGRMPRQLESGQREGSLGNTCDGLCGKQWKYADDIYCCKFCPDVQFCVDCREKQEAGKLQRFICSPKHDWLHVPKWDDEEYVKVGRGNVKVGGEWDGQKRVGGEVVTIEKWLNSLRDYWGVPQIAADEKPNINGITSE